MRLEAGKNKKTKPALRCFLFERAEWRKQRQSRPAISLSWMESQRANLACQHPSQQRQPRLLPEALQELQLDVQNFVKDE